MSGRPHRRGAARPPGETLPQPRRGWTRRVLFQVHLWTGLGVGLYMFVSSVTGAALVFHEGLGQLAQGHLHRVPAADLAAGRPISMETARQALARALPDVRVLSLAPPQTADGTFVAGVLAPGYRLAFIHPVTEQVTGPVAPGGETMSWLHEMHANLLSGRTGRVVNGVGGGLLVLLGLTGLVIWWPRRGQIRRALVFRRGVGWKRLMVDIHNVTGFWLLVPTIVLAVTGSYFTWPAYYRAAVSWVSPVSPVSVPRGSTPSADDVPFSLDTVLAQVQAVEGGRIVRVGLPGQPAQPYTVFVQGAHSASPRAQVRYFVDQHTGRVLEVRPPSRYQTVGDAVVDWLGPLHTGNFGGPVVKTLWTVVGLAPALLFATGFMMWWNRVVQPERRRAVRRRECQGAGETFGPDEA